MNKNVKIGIALSGGGVRGVAHLGVLQALQDNGIHFHRISGASAGAIMGALYAYGIQPREILKLSSQYSIFTIFKNTFVSGGLARLNFLEDLICDLIKPNDFSALKIPLDVSVSNLNTGLPEIMNAGKLSTVITASASIPILFSPVEINGQQYVDGGFFDNLPVDGLKKHCDVVIGVNINAHGQVNDLDGIRSISERCFHLLIWQNTQGQLNSCDIKIEIEGAFTFGLLDFKQAEKLFQVGYNETLEQIEHIRDVLSTLQTD